MAFMKTLSTQRYLKETENTLTSIEISRKNLGREFYHSPIATNKYYMSP